MIPVATLLATATTFWAQAAPGVAEQNCPDGVSYNVKAAAAMDNHGAGVRAEARLGSCVITFRAGWRQRVTDRGACRIVIHEMGHAALRLSHDDGGVMSDGRIEGTQRVGDPAACMKYSNR